MSEAIIPKILIAEDERLIALDIKNIITNFGYKKVFLVHSAKDALKFIHNGNTPDLILMDIMMEEGMTGIDAAREIIQVAEIPIIFITASTDKSTLKEALLTKPVEILIKPFSNIQLKTAIERAFKKI